MSKSDVWVRNETTQSDSGHTTTYTYGDATDHSGDVTSVTDSTAGSFGFLRTR
jgi:hypothetical protein